jgi:hypothetical protein
MKGSMGRKKWMRDLKRTGFGLFLASFFFISCATAPPVKKADERELLRNRVDQYWQYLVKQEIEKAYQCEAPSFREKVSILEYVNRYKLVKYMDAQVSKVELDGNRGKVTTDITYRMFLRHVERKNLKKSEEEAWIKIKDNWYHLPEGF